MTSAKIIVKNAGWLFTANIVSNLVGFVLIVLIARFLGDENLGLYSFAFAFTSIFAVLFDLGVLQFSLRELSRDKSKTRLYYWNIAAIKLFVGIIALVLPIAILFFRGTAPRTLEIVIIAGIAMFFNYYTSIFRMLFQAHEIMKYDALIGIIERTFALIVGGAVLFLGGGLFHFTLVLLVSYFIYFIAGIIFTSKKISKFSLEIDFEFWKFILKKSLPFWLSLVFIKIYFQIDTIMLPAIKDYVVTGWYNAAYSLVNGLTFIVFVVMFATFPAMSVLHIKNKELLKKLYNKCFSYLFMIGFPIAIGTLLLSERIVVFLYKEKFIHSSPALQVLIWAELFLFFNYLMGTLLNSTDKQKWFTYSTGICVVLNIVLNFILIPEFSYIGAAAATVMTEIVNFGILYYFTSKAGYGLRIFRLTVKPVIAALIMGLFVYFFRSMHLLIIIPLAGIIYFLMLVLSKAIGKEEFDLVRSLLEKSK